MEGFYQLLKDMINQNTVLFCAAVLADISAILYHAYGIRKSTVSRGTETRETDKSSSAVGTVLIWVAVLLTACMFFVLFTQDKDKSVIDPISKTESAPIIDNSNFLYYNGHTYSVIISSTINSFSDAEKYCKNLGGHLAIIDDDLENEQLYNYVFNNLKLKSAYFGLTDKNQEDEWKWVDGSYLTYSNWTEGEPHDLGGEDYALFYYKDYSGKWYDGDFGKNPDTVNFICEWDYEY